MVGVPLSCVALAALDCGGRPYQYDQPGTNFSSMDLHDEDSSMARQGLYAQDETSKACKEDALSFYSKQHRNQRQIDATPDPPEYLLCPVYADSQRAKADNGGMGAAGRHGRVHSGQLCFRTTL